MRKLTDPQVWSKLMLSLAVFILALAVWPSAQTTNAPAPVVTGPAKLLAPALDLLSLDAAKLTFGLDKFEALKGKVFAIPLWQYIAFILYLVIAFFVTKATDWLISGRLKKWAAGTQNKFDDLLLELLRGPLKFVLFLLFFQIGLQVFPWPLWLEEWLKRGLYVAIAISITYIIIKLVDLLVDHWRQRTVLSEDRSFNDQIFPLVKKTLKFFVIVVSVLVTSDNLGLKLTSVIASLSIGSLALGLAAQDTLANFFGAFAILIDKPFRLGDQIQVNNVDGVVETIGLRSTRIRHPDGHLITIPNKTMGSATITNVSSRPTIRTLMNLGIASSTSPEKTHRTILLLNEIFRAHPKTHDVIVSFNRIADSSLNIHVIHWLSSTDPKEHLAVLSELNLEVTKRFGQEQIELAYPTQTVYIRQEGGLPE